MTLTTSLSQDPFHAYRSLLPHRARAARDQGASRPFPFPLSPATASEAVTDAPRPPRPSAGARIGRDGACATAWMRCVQLSFRQVEKLMLVHRRSGRIQEIQLLTKSCGGGRGREGVTLNFQGCFLSCNCSRQTNFHLGSAHTHTHTNTHTRTHTSSHTYTHIHAHTHKHTHTHAHVSARLSSCTLLLNSETLLKLTTMKRFKMHPVPRTGSTGCNDRLNLHRMAKANIGMELHRRPRNWCGSGAAMPSLRNLMNFAKKTFVPQSWFPAEGRCCSLALRERRCIRSSTVQGRRCSSSAEASK